MELYQNIIVKCITLTLRSFPVDEEVSFSINIPVDAPDRFLQASKNNLVIENFPENVQPRWK